ncbi:HD-GYP domain-containing protein [Streptomyces mexicanus]|uniref:HD-GYP domain-containing protein n=1 Tax=Streptomyces mexicanus TaxID=178566 RepID=UPI001356F3D3|nr:HD-GYP domain-containing protein [Streptomyces mexicanus]
MEAVPRRARVYVACVVLGALPCVLPVLPALPLTAAPGTGTPWAAVLPLAALYAGCEQLARRRFAGTGYPVLLAAAFLLPPSAAALVALPGALLARAGRHSDPLRRAWRASQLALAVWAAARAHTALGGHDTVAACRFPAALGCAGAAAVAFSLVLTALDGGIRATCAHVPLRRAWRGLFARTLAPVAVHGLAGLMMAVLWRSPYGPVAALLVLLPMGASWWAYAQYDRERAAHRATIRALVQAVDLKDGYTRGHSERVGRASMMIARELGMDDERVEVLRFAGILHDIGKLGVPTRLLRKDGPLTPEERRVIELHPEYGHEMVRGISFLGEARAAILHHHERLDGSGYPYGLSGDRIPECARVVAVADAFDAMTSSRSYRRPRPVPEALRELRRCAGAQFAPRMVTALVRALARHGWHPAVTADDDRTPAPAAPPEAHTPARSPEDGGARGTGGAAGAGGAAEEDGAAVPPEAAEGAAARPGTSGAAVPPESGAAARPGGSARR